MLAHPCVVTKGRVHSLFLCVLSLLSGASIFSLSTPLLAQATTPTVTLAVRSGNSNVTTVPMGRVVTLTASVLSTNPVVGQVLFCEATAAFCQNAAVAVVQALPSGQASFSFVPGPGVHSYKAVLVASDRYFRSESSAQPLSVTASLATTTALATGGVAGGYVLGTTTNISGAARPTGNVIFSDTTSNAALGSANVTASAASAALSVAGTPAVGNESFNVQTARLQQ